jgi:hypothetical protein
MEVAATHRMEQRLGMVGEPYSEGTSGTLMKAGEGMLLAGAAAAGAGRWKPWLSRVGGALLVAASAVTRLGIFQAGMASADDPRYTVEPQRERLRDEDLDHEPAEGPRAPEPPGA